MTRFCLSDSAGAPAESERQNLVIAEPKYPGKLNKSDTLDSQLRNIENFYLFGDSDINLMSLFKDDADHDGRGAHVTSGAPLVT